jgi:hypothetical protein
MSTATRSRLRRLLLAAIPAALAVSLFAASPASAGYFGAIAIVDADSGQEVVIDGEPHVCGFWIEFDFDRVVDVVAWEIKEWNASPLDGATVLQGQGGPTDADGKLRQPESGSLTLPDGHYSIVWDDEPAVDATSFGNQSFVVECEDQSTGGSQPAPTDTGTDLGAGGGGGGVAGLTAPPTDARAEASPASSSTAVPFAISLLAIVTLAFTTSGQRLHERARRPTR